MQAAHKVVSYILTVALITPIIHAISVGWEINPVSIDGQDLLTDINFLHQQIYSIPQSTNKKDLKKIESLNAKIKSIVNDYIINNSCLRYYLDDYVSYNENEMNSNINSGLFVSINFEFDNIHEMDQRSQVFNLNILDKFANTLRRINKIEQNKLNVLIDYPLIEKSQDYLKTQYFDICFENLKYDKSWNSNARPINAYIDIFFGLNSISKKYEKTSELIFSISESLDTVYHELEGLTAEYVHYLRNDEPDFRDMNEDTLTKYTVSMLILILVTLSINAIQAFWLIKHLKRRGSIK